MKLGLFASRVLSTSALSAPTTITFLVAVVRPVSFCYGINERSMIPIYVHVRVHKIQGMYIHACYGKKCCNDTASEHVYDKEK